MRNKRHSYALTFLAIIGTSIATHAAVITWEGGTSAFTDANWTVDATPNQNHPGIVGNTTTISSGTVTDFTNANVGSIGGDTSLVIDGGAISGDYLAAFGDSGHSNDITLLSGSITMDSFNSFRTSSGSFAGLINFTGAAGSAFVSQTNLTGTTAQEMAGKIGAVSGTRSFFAIDGTEVASGVTYDGTNLSAVNAALATKVFGGRYFEILESGGTQTLTLVAVPEPSSFALLAGMFGLTWAMLRRRA